MEIGIVVCGPSRGGKWETKGVLGGGRDNENSAAREESWDVVEPRAIRRFTGGSAESSDTMDWDERSWAKASAGGEHHDT